MFSVPDLLEEDLFGVEAHLELVKEAAEVCGRQFLVGVTHVEVSREQVLVR